MNDLPTLLHDRADRAHLVPVDLDEVTRAGARRVRRRRTAALAIALATVLGGTSVLGDGGDAGDRAVDTAGSPPVSTARPSWYVDGMLHHGGTSTALGLDVVTYVRTSVGFVLVDTRDRVWSWTGGDPVEVGVASPTEDMSQRLVGDGDGDLAAWVDSTGADRAVVVLDQATGEVRSVRPVGAGDAVATALDGDRVWWRDGASSLTLSLAEPDADPERLPDGTTVLAAQAGRIVYEEESGVSTSIGIRPGADAVVLDETYSDVGALSPDGSLWSTDADEVSVRRTSDGRITGDLPLDAPFSTGYEWLSDDSLVVLAGYPAADGSGEGSTLQARILVCSLPTGDCSQVASDLGTFDELEAGDFALPLGVPLG